MTTPCPTCNGSGKLHSDNGPAPQIWDCWDCGGDDGWDDEEGERLLQEQEQDEERRRLENEEMDRHFRDHPHG